MLLLEDKETLVKLIEDKHYKMDFGWNNYIKIKNCDDNLIVYINTSLEELEESLDLIKKFHSARNYTFLPLYLT